MTNMRNMFMLLGLLILMVMGARYVPKTAVAQTIKPRVYLPLIISSGSTDPGDPGEPGVIGPVHDGIATYYDPIALWNCGFPMTSDDKMFAAINYTEYGNADLCGAFVRVTGRKGTVIVRIVDNCGNCPILGHLDLSREAFALIDDIPLGRVPITWQIVSPEMTGPIRFEFKEKNQWWTAVQVRNHRNPIAKFEYLSGNSYVEVAKTSYNYFVEASGMGVGPYTFRVTDVLGNQIVSSGIPLSNPGIEIDGSGQFPPP